MLLVGAIGAACWWERREIGEIGVVVACCGLFIVVTRVTFPSFAASLCLFVVLLALAGVHN